MRLHQLAAGQDLRRRDLARMFAGTGIRFRLARVSTIDTDHHTVTDARGSDRWEYDTLSYTLGSTVADHGVPGVPEHVFHVTERSAALRLRRRLSDLNGQGRALVVGGNLTAIEAATEIAESHPGLRVDLATTGDVGDWLGPKAHRHLLRAFDRLGIGVHEHTTTECVRRTKAIGSDGTVFPSDVTVWAAGFTDRSIAVQSGISVTGNGRIIVDQDMRSVSHPEVFAAGDGVHALGRNGRPLPMNCVSAQVTTRQAVAAIIERLSGRGLSRFPLVYLGNHVSLGREDAFYQLVDAQGRARSWAWTGSWAWSGSMVARFKSAVLTGAAWRMGRPSLGFPARKRRLITQARHRSQALAP